MLSVSSLVLLILQNLRYFVRFVIGVLRDRACALSVTAAIWPNAEKSAEGHIPAEIAVHPCFVLMGMTMSLVFKMGAFESFWMLRFM